jgi:hypothetical protein
VADFRKEIAKIRRHVESLPGYTWEEAAKKHRVTAPDGRRISISKTPSASNAIHKIHADLKRIGIDLGSGRS